MLLNEVANKSETLTEFDDKIVMDGRLEIGKSGVIAARSGDLPGSRTLVPQSSERSGRIFGTLRCRALYPRIRPPLRCNLSGPLRAMLCRLLTVPEKASSAATGLPSQDRMDVLVHLSSRRTAES